MPLPRIIVHEPNDYDVEDEVGREEMKGHAKSFELDDKYRKYLTLLSLEELIVI